MKNSLPRLFSLAALLAGPGIDLPSEAELAGFNQVLQVFAWAGLPGDVAKAKSQTNSFLALTGMQPSTRASATPLRETASPGGCTQKVAFQYSLREEAIDVFAQAVVVFKHVECRERLSCLAWGLQTMRRDLHTRIDQLEKDR